MEHKTDILNELQSISPLLAAMEKVNVFTLPAGYFEGLSAMVLSVAKDEALKAKTQVPAGYFDTLADSILHKLKDNGNTDALPEILKTVQHKPVYTVPDGYFETLSGNILQQLQQQGVPAETTEASSLLEPLKHINVYEVPENYFTRLPDEILLKVQPAAGAKLVTMPRYKSWMRYAVAAVFSGVILFAVDKFKNPPAASAAKLTDTQKKGIGLSKDSAATEAIYAQVSDDEIVKFLGANGDDVDAALAACNADENDLEDTKPDDDRALDNLLENINENDLKN
jgi:hypothetical protein